MKFAPKTQEELDKEGLLPDGVYDFEVFRAEDKISKKGNEMIELGLRIFAPDGSTPFVNDYLLESMAYKLRHFCESVGLVAAYEDGSLTASDCEQRSGKAKIVIDPAKNGYPAKNAVKDYVLKDEASDEMPGKSAAEVSPEDDDIPF